MDFFKSAAALISNQRSAFPFSYNVPKFGPRDSLWTLYDGKDPEGGDCTVWTFDCLRNPNRVEVARNAVQKLKTLHHPGILKFIASHETDSMIYMATEPADSLENKISSFERQVILWGLHNIARTASFLNEEAKVVHGNLSVSAVFVSQTGEWKLGGCEILTNLKSDDNTIFVAHKFASILTSHSVTGRYCRGPRVFFRLKSTKEDGILLKGKHVLYRISTEVSSVGGALIDAYFFGELIYEIFNGKVENNSSLMQKKRIPDALYPHYKLLISRNSASRLTIKSFLEIGDRAGGFFDTQLIRCCDRVHHLALLSFEEKQEFLKYLIFTQILQALMYRAFHGLVSIFPSSYLERRVLPELLKLFELGGGGSLSLKVVLEVVDKSKSEAAEDLLQAALVRSFASQDRAVRLALLENTSPLLEKLPDKIVNDKIFGHFATGFVDTVPVVREQTVRAVLAFVPRLSSRTLNNDLLKLMAKCQSDEQPGIRTNTTICLGKIAASLNENTRKKVLIPAFTRSLRDPFVPARNAALLAIAATANILDETECAVRVVPSLSPLLIDKDSTIRENARRAIDLCLQRVATYADNMVTRSDEGSQTQREGYFSGFASSAISKVMRAHDLKTVDLQARPSSAPIDPQTSRPTTSTPQPTITHPPVQEPTRGTDPIGSENLNRSQSESIIRPMGRNLPNADSGMDTPANAPFSELSVADEDNADAWNEDIDWGDDEEYVEDTKRPNGTSQSLNVDDEDTEAAWGDSWE